MSSPAITVAERAGPVGVPTAASARFAPAAAPGVLRITGRVTQPAELRHTVGHEPRALLAMELSTGSGLPFWAQQDLGTDFAAHLAAASKARLCGRGAAVTVLCRGLRVKTDHGHAQALCLQVLDVIPHHVPAHPGVGPEGA